MYSTLDKNEAIDRLQKTEARLCVTISGLSNEQLNFKPAPDAWSAANIVEHLAIVEALVSARVIDQLAVAPERQPGAELEAEDAALLAKVADRSVKFQSPPQGHPTGKGVEDSLSRFIRNRRRILEFVQSEPPHLRQRVIPHPVFGPIDGHQWILALSGHCARHTDQIVEALAAQQPA